MRKSFKYYLSIITITAILLTGCGETQNNQTQTESSADSTAETEVLAADVTSQVVVDTEFTARDLEVGYEESTAAYITLAGSNIEISGDGAAGAAAKDGVLTISKEGTYVITGTLNNGQIIVDAGDTDKVHIVLNGVTISCSDNAPIYIKNADKAFITLAEGTENSLTDGTEYVQADDNNVDGVIFSTADLTINGDGILNITGNYKHGIVSKDDLVITGGTFNITAVKDALNGKDCVKIKAGTFNLSADTGNGIQSKNGDDTTKGYVYITGGDITVLNSQEGIEGTVILIADGTINVTAEDDGFNASSGSSSETDASAANAGGNNITKEMPNEAANATADKAADATADKAINATADAATDETSGTTTSQTGAQGPGNSDRSDRGNFGGGFGGGGGGFEADTNCYISITGGTININAGGDGIDSNGSLYISGGNTYVSGPTNSGNGALDYNGTAEITGGTIIAAGSTGMAQGFADTSSQYSLLYNLTAASEAGTEVKLTDQEGSVVASYKPDKEYQSVIISTPELAKDETYTLTCGEQTEQITLSSVVTSNGQQQGMGGQGGRRGQPGQDDRVLPGDGNTTESIEGTDDN